MNNSSPRSPVPGIAPRIPMPSGCPVVSQTFTVAHGPGSRATAAAAAEGAATGVKEAGKTDQVKIVGFDAGPKQVADLKAGTVQALIAQKPADIGAQGVQQAYAALTGKPTKAKIGTGFVSLTKDNLAENSDAAYKASC